jgi:hypothetical protein
MAFVARKPFLYNSKDYQPGDVVQGFPDDWARPESFIQAGFIVEKKPTEVKPLVKKTTRVKSGV